MKTAQQITREVFGVDFNSLCHPEMPKPKQRYFARWINQIGVEIAAEWHEHAESKEYGFFTVNGALVGQDPIEIMGLESFQWKTPQRIW